MEIAWSWNSSKIKIIEIWRKNFNNELNCEALLALQKIKKTYVHGYFKPSNVKLYYLI